MYLTTEGNKNFKLQILLRGNINLNAEQQQQKNLNPVSKRW